MDKLSDKYRIICLAGPTASGKTALALQLADVLNVEIISVDSALVYRGLDIGTAKPDAVVRAQVPHHLIDIRDPQEVYSAAHFCEDANAAIDAIIARGRTPLLVGGTMLYYRALLKGLSPLPSAHPALRESISARAKTLGWAALHAELQQCDPLAASRIHPNDPQRIQRALEVCLATGKSLSMHFDHCLPTQDKFDWQMIALIPADREQLHGRIAKRFQAMLTQGFLDEVEKLYARGDLDPNLPAIRSVGYRQAWAYLSGSINYDQMCEKSIVATRQLAKRQLTWLRNWPDLSVFDPFHSNLLSKVLTLL